jgi:hypothetical protein
MDNLLGHILFICQYCNTRQLVQDQAAMSQPYFFISSSNPFVPEMIGKN